MALYFGDNKVKINLNCVTYCLNLFSTPVDVDGIRLLSSDNYILSDSDGVYLLPRIDNRLFSLDGYVLTDRDRIYLATKESD